MFSLVSGLPSTASCGLPWPSFGCFGGTPLYDSPSPFIWVLQLIAFSQRSASYRPRTATGPVLAHGVSMRAWGLRLRRHGTLALVRTALLPSVLADAVGSL